MAAEKKEIRRREKVKTKEKDENQREGENKRGSIKEGSSCDCTYCIVSYKAYEADTGNKSVKDWKLQQRQ